MSAVFDLDLPSSEKLVLLAMADHARDDGTGCYPSVDRLARKSSLSRRGVQKIARRLEQAGLIEPSKVSRGRRSTEYRITLDNREPRSLFPPTQPRTPGHPTANLSASNREPGSPESSGTVIEPSGSQNPAAMPLGDRRHRPFVEFATEAYITRFGQAPTWSGKDFKHLSDLLRRAPAVPAEDLRRRFGFYLDSTDSFIVGNGHALWLFCGKYDALREGPIVQTGGGLNGESKLRGNELDEQILRVATTAGRGAH